MAKKKEIIWTKVLFQIVRSSEEGLDSQVRTIRASSRKKFTEELIRLSREVVAKLGFEGRESFPYEVLPDEEVAILTYKDFARKLYSLDLPNPVGIVVYGVNKDTEFLMLKVAIDYIGSYVPEEKQND